ncbi:MAG TPA: SPFH domain-containing protein [Candidatus Baltobacteraceae bacterium]|nr:SPFH domain-containing protein [Candidatus Baltobacteraceae bacterium]
MGVLAGSLAGLVGLIVVAALLGVLLFRAMWRVAEPNEALIISGVRHGNTPDGLGFKIVTGHGTMVVPGIQTVRRLSLDLREADLTIDCVTHQGIPVKIRGVVIYKVGDDYASIANAARRFLDQQQQMDGRIQNVFAGHLRAIVGSLTVEDLIRDRDKLSDAARGASGVEMQKLGLVVDSLQIQEIDDPTGYIENLARPHIAEVQKQARIAQASADKEATQAEQDSAAQKAQSVRDSSIKQAGYQAEVDQAHAQAAQAGPLATAQAQQQVVVEQAKMAELEANRKEKQLQIDVRKPADAEAYAVKVKAEASRDAAIAAAQAEAQRVQLEAEARAAAVRITGQAEGDANKARGLGEAEATRAKGLAEADATKARADALAHNQEAVIGLQLAERWPQIVEQAAKAFSSIDNLTVLDGAQGVSKSLGEVIGAGAAGLSLLRNAISGIKAPGNGAVPASPDIDQLISPKV